MTARNLKTEEVADELRTSAAQVCRLIRRGDLAPVIKTDKRYLVPEATLHRYLTEHTIGEAS